MRYYTTLFFVLIGLIGFTQIKSDSVLVKDGAQYYVHQVKKGETLANLSRLYQVSLSQTKKANPNAESLAINQWILIPIVAKPRMEVKPVTQEALYAQHVVQTQETIYGISKSFKITSDSLFLLNPTLKQEGLKAGDTLIVGVKKVQVKPVSGVVKQPKYIYHEVKPQETIYALTKLYGVTVQDLYQWNPSLQEFGLKAGDEVVVGYSKSPKNKDIDTLLAYKQQKIDDQVLAIEQLIKSSGDSTKHINQDTAFIVVAVLLPLHLNKQTAYLNDEGALLQDTKISLDFYTGFMQALQDSLIPKGLRIRVLLEDTENDSAKVVKIMQKEQILKANLIIGPVYTNNFKIAASIAHKQLIPIVNPFGINQEIHSFPNVIRMRYIQNDLFQQSILYLTNQHAKNNIIVTYEASNIKKATAFKQQLLGQIEQRYNFTPKIHLAEGAFNPVSFLSKNEQNVVFVLSSKEGYVSKLAAKLYPKTKEYRIAMIGLEDWKEFRNIESSYWDSLNIHISGNLNHLYGHDHHPLVLAKYFDTHHREMNFYSMMGFDVAWVLFQDHLRDAQFNVLKIQDKTYQGVLMSYRFKPLVAQQAIVNQSAHMYRYHKYEFIKK